MVHIDVLLLHLRPRPFSRPMSPSPYCPQANSAQNVIYPINTSCHWVFLSSFIPLLVSIHLPGQSPIRNQSGNFSNSFMLYSPIWSINIITPSSALYGDKSFKYFTLLMISLCSSLLSIHVVIHSTPKQGLSKALWLFLTSGQKMMLAGQGWPHLFIYLQSVNDFPLHQCVKINSVSTT